MNYYCTMYVRLHVYRITTITTTTKKKCKKKEEKKITHKQDPSNYKITSKYWVHCLADQDVLTSNERFKCRSNIFFLFFCFCISMNILCVLPDLFMYFLYISYEWLVLCGYFIVGIDCVLIVCARLCMLLHDMIWFCYSTYLCVCFPNCIIIWIKEQTMLNDV